MKYILVSGGVVSGIGKGVIGTLYKTRGLRCGGRLTVHRSLFDWSAPEDDWSEGHGDKD